MEDNKKITDNILLTIHNHNKPDNMRVYKYKHTQHNT